MVAVRKPDILQEARRRGAKLRRVGVEFIGPCPRCGGRDRFAINTKKQIFVCRQGGVGGDVIDLVQYLEGLNYKSAVERLARNELGIVPAVQTVTQVDTNNLINRKRAEGLWTDARPLAGTLGERYFVEHRRLAIAPLGDLSVSGP